MKKPKLIFTAFKAEADMLRRVDHYAEKLSASTPGCTRSHALRALLLRALEQVENPKAA